MDINGIYALKSLSITGTNIHAILSTIDQVEFIEKSLIGIRAEDGIVMDNATFNCRTLAPDTRGQGISCAGSITIKNGSYVDISVAGSENKPAYSLCGISVPTDSASAKIIIRDSKVSVETGASGGGFYHNYGIRGAVDIQGSSVVDAHAGETLSSGLNSFGMFAYTANNTNPLYTTPLKISDTSVVTVSGHTACLYTSSSQFDLNNFPNLRDHAFADAGKALVSTNVTGEDASPWEPYYQEPGAGNYEGDYINAFKYARFPQYLESDLAKISISDPGGDGALITQNSFHVPKGTSMDIVMHDAHRYFKDGNESGYYYEYDSSDPDEGIFCALVNEKTNQTIYIGFARTYTNRQAWYDDLAAKINGKTAEGDIVLYLIREKTVTDTGVVVDIPSPAPGTDSFTNPPKFINHSKQLIAYSIAHMAGPDCWWIADPNSPSGIGYSPYDGPIEAGKDYYTLFMAIPEFGWYVPKDESIPATVRGGTVVEILQPQDMSLYIVKVRAGMGNNQIAADTVAETLNKLPAASSITLAHANAVKAARAAYNKLSADAKKLVAPAALKKLTNAEAQIAKLTYNKNVKAAKAYKVKGLKVKALKKRKASVTWTKNSKATGYQIQYAMNKKFKKAKKKTIKGASNKKATLSKFKAGKTYYVRIRTYKALKNPATGKTTKIYGKWSTAKKIKAIK